jgi:hypothetical protein
MGVNEGVRYGTHSRVSIVNKRPGSDPPRLDYALHRLDDDPGVEDSSLSTSIQWSFR